ncbi:putative carboxypeptidase C [Helianthus annuus]|uniref:Carboxypeptidase n=1 Tax=Helianthus annuus TaxID=4232 RepID=A0A9K3EI03_HELAN|nr:serine carboxypeptidase-like 51 [Helianthus annuus]KAF5772669.1 putative carboxypeptidase C [Helianthus annuus]KAJ0476279.1 putative carboxypeptidase C [Helianthus annuus]KAJ0480397.1 putative carboxypeptidase C [Helianthus annuus]KAJ0497086.1 putative carboxypeptidase C [Helianthus annuus]KAJ0848490.1 putative carboxypeptidase C [Helianthus annuus]
MVIHIEKALFSLLFILSYLYGGLAIGMGTQDGSEKWGYIPVRPKAQMFWWYYRSPFRTQDPNNLWPIILWLQGGPGSSGVGFGNFKEIGPLDTFLNPRNSTWLKKADLLFVDNPVGVGYSFVEDETLYVRNDEEAARDLTTLLIAIFNEDESLQKSPLYIMGESYGGKYGVTLALYALKAIQAKQLNLILGGIVLGDTWISPEDYVASWGPLLKDISRLDNNGLKKYNSLVDEIKEQVAYGRFEDAIHILNSLETGLQTDTNNVNFYNFLLDDDSASSTTTTQSQEAPSGDLESLMNGAIRSKLQIIPDNVKWKMQSPPVFKNMRGDFMRPRINEVDELLKKGVDVTIYNGQLDVICATKGTEAWVEKLKWEGLEAFLSIDRTPIYCGDEKVTKGFTKSYKNLHFYWILGAGHMVPEDQPCVAFNMVGNITNSSGPATF